MLYSLRVNSYEPAIIPVSTPTASPFDVLMIRGLPPEGMPVTLDVQAGAPFQFHLVDKTEGLPAMPDVAFKGRSPLMLRSRELDFYNDSTLVSKKFTP
jgi:hypothetical protein